MVHNPASPPLFIPPRETSNASWMKNCSSTSNNESARKSPAAKTPDEARYAALRAMQGLEQRKEECRDTRRVNLIENLKQDASYAWRSLISNPGFTAVAVLTLALGIGATSAIFSVINAALLRPLPYPHPNQLILLFEKDVLEAGGGPNIVAFANFADWEHQSHSFVSHGGRTAGSVQSRRLGHISS